MLGIPLLPIPKTILDLAEEFRLEKEKQGVYLICRYSRRPDLDEKKGRDIEILKQHNIKNIFDIIKKETYDDNILKDFFKMIGFDALIGHGDRHWCNYGFLKPKMKNSYIRFAPVLRYLLRVFDRN